MKYIENLNRAVKEHGYGYADGYEYGKKMAIFDEFIVSGLLLALSGGIGRAFYGYRKYRPTAKD